MEKKHLLKIFDQGCAYAKLRDYAGYSKFDAFESPLIKLLTPPFKWPRLIASQVIMRSPVNLRPLFGVRKGRNPKGVALFAKAYLNAYKVTKKKSYLEEAEKLLGWLDTHYSKGYSGKCWGYNFDWQDIGFFAPKFMPNCIVTCFVLDSFALAYEVTKKKKYLDTLSSGSLFILKDLKKLTDTKDMLCVSYAPVDMDMVVMDTSAWSSAILSKLYSYTKKKEYKAYAKRLMNYVVDKQTKYHAWYYSHPPKSSHITHDNYHTGYVLDCLLDYMTYCKDTTWQSNYEKGLAYYYLHLFTSKGEPKFMNNQTYPFDIHGAAQGIVTFSKAISLSPKYAKIIDKILSWSTTEMLDPSGYFYYQKTKWGKKKFLLMRWNQAWMCNAMSYALLTMSS